MGKVICQLVPYICVECFLKIFGQVDLVEKKPRMKQGKCMCCDKTKWIVNVKAWGFQPLTFMAVDEPKSKREKSVRKDG